MYIVRKQNSGDHYFDWIFWFSWWQEEEPEFVAEDEVDVSDLSDIEVST